MEIYEFDCGCKYNIIKELPGYDVPLLDIDYQKHLIPYDGNKNVDCPRAWQLFHQGLTGGVFQLESNLGRKYCKELRPTTIDHLGALTSILRPGCLNNKDEDGVSVTQYFCDIKNERREMEIKIEALKDILEPTYGQLVFQEQQIRIGIEIGGMSPSDADYYLRKGVGTKNAEILFSAESKFLEGCKRVGKVSDEEAKTIFSWIKSAARYSFNKSHGYQYGIRAWQDAYLKTHWPLQFYTSKLKSPRNSTTHDDIHELIYEAKLFGVQTKLPNLKHLRPTFYNDGEHIYFGLVDIKDFGDSSFKTLCEVWATHHKKLTGEFLDFVINVTRYLTPSMVKLLIEAGAVDWFGICRQQMLAEFSLVSDLTKTEKEHLYKYYDAVKAGLNPSALVLKENK